MKLSVVIPVYNEKATIEKIIKSVKDVSGIDKEIVIVDDASKDKNMGKGHTLKMGFSYTTGDYVIVQDADLEYDPQEYHKLIRALDEEGVDVVYGSRFSGNYKDMSSAHYIGNKALTLLTNMIFGVMLTDMETCYKLIPGDFARKVVIKSHRFDFEPEITAKILKAGLKIREVPISYKGRSHFEGKKITWRDGIVAFWTLFKYRFIN